MHKINFTRKAAVQSAIVGAVFVAVLLAGVSERTAIGQPYQSVLVDGAKIAATGRKTDVARALREARRELSAEEGGRLCMDYDWEAVPERTVWETLLTEEELKEALKEALRKTILKDKERVYTVAIDGYRANFRSLEEVGAFLDRVKAQADEQDAYRTQVFQNDSHIGGILNAVLVERAGEAGDAPAPEQSGEVEETAASGDEAGSAAKEGARSGADIRPAEDGAGDRADSRIAGVFAGIWGALTQPGEAIPGPSEEGYQNGLLDLEFVETVKVYENYVDADQLSDLEEELIEVTKEKESNKIYVVESGDCLSVIAIDHDTTVSSIVALNQLTDADSIREGQELVIAVPEPDLKLRITAGEVYEEDYTMEPVIRENDSWYTNQEVVRQEGTTGHRERNDVVVYENGIEISREMIHENIMTESLPAIIERGTIIPPTYIKPISGGRYTSGFGRRWGRMHTGVDWACPTGTTVYASSGGTVIQASYNGGYGNNVVISHPDGRLTRYAHNSRLLVHVGQTVKQGEAIALSGSTGRSTGPHVHFEIYINGAAVNPLNYIGN